MKCTGCKKELLAVRISAVIEQRGILKGNKIVEYKEWKPIEDSKKIECPACGKDIEESIKE